MNRSIYLGIAILLAASGVECAIAQSVIVPDGTLGAERSRVNPFDVRTDLIEGGAIRGINLFHSFQDFNVGVERSVYFVSPNIDVQNVFARVTGGNSSQILGRLGTIGQSRNNLFLINPNGIVFGKDATLDVSGSFFATTASRIQFGDRGNFSSNRPEVASDLLTINPSAFLFNQIPVGKIAVNSATLQVPNGQTLGLVGGDIEIDGGQLSALGGRVEIGAFNAPRNASGVVGLGKVGLNPDGSLSFLPGNDRRDVLLTRGAFIDVKLSGKGDIGITAQNINVFQGSAIDAGTIPSPEGTGSQAGNIILNAIGVIDVASSYIRNSTREGNSNAGDVRIKTARLLLRDGAFIATPTFSGSNGRGGNLTINASESVEVVGTTENGLSGSGLSTETQGSGRAGDLWIKTPFLSVRDGGLILARTAGSGEGGNLIIDESNLIEVSGSAASNKFSSAISARTSGSGRAGNLTIKTNYLFVRNGGAIAATAARNSSGNAGKLEIQAAEAIDLSGFTPRGSSGISAAASVGATGDAGDILVQAKRLTVRDGAGIFASNLGSGQAGTLYINAKEFVEVLGRSNSYLNVISGLDATGKGGSLIIETPRLSVRDGSQVLITTLGKADAGNLKVIAPESVEIIGVSLIDGLPSQINAASGVSLAQLEDETPGRISNFTGQGGNIDIRTGSLMLKGGGTISSSAFGEGNAGSIVINVDKLLRATDGVISTTALQSSGGNISIKAENIRLVGDSAITTNVSGGTGKGGDITLTANSIIALDQSDILSFSREGAGGNITFVTRALLSSPLYRPKLSTVDRDTLDTLRNNGRVDINASGVVSGAIVGVPDITFLQNSLTQLPQTAIDTNTLLANSCIIRDRTTGTFYIKGSGGLPIRPGDVPVSPYPTGTIQSVQPSQSLKKVESMEPQAAYQLADGRIVLSRECEQNSQ